MSTVTNDKPTAPAKTPMRKAQVLDYLHIKGSTLGDWVRLRGFPKPVRPTPNTPGLKRMSTLGYLKHGQVEVRGSANDDKMEST